MESHLSVRVGPVILLTQLISSPDLVLAVSRKGKKFGAKNGGRGRGGGEEETRSGKLRSEMKFNWLFR